MTRSAGLLLSLGLALLTAGSLVGERPSRTLSWSGDARSIEIVELRAGNGEVTVLPSEKQEIRLELEVRAERTTGDEAWRSWISWFLRSRYEDDAELVRDISLEVETSRGRLEIRPRPQGRTRESRIRERWTLHLPARISVEVHGNSLATQIEGREAKVQVSAGHGAVELAGCGRDARVELQVGRIEYRTDQPLASFFARSEVGSVEGEIFGRRVSASREPGPGQEIRHLGPAGASVRLELEVGDIRFALQAPNEPSP